MHSGDGIYTFVIINNVKSLSDFLLCTIFEVQRRKVQLLQLDLISSENRILNLIKTQRYDLKNAMRFNVERKSNSEYRTLEIQGLCIIHK